MRRDMVLTVMASDRPGIVETLAEVIAGHGGNWVDSAMSRLGGEFAGILRLTIDDQRVSELVKALAELKGQGFTIAVRHNREEGEAESAKQPVGRPAYFELTGQDHKGIIRDVSRVLAKNNVNVDELRTHVFSGAMSGEHMFSAEADILLPEGLEMEDLCEQLEDIASDLMVEVRMCSIRSK